MQKVFVRTIALHLGLTLAVFSSSAYGADKPDAMKKPVDGTTIPEETTGKNMENAPGADNTSRNAVHDGKKAVSADQQSNDPADVEITRKIRQAIVKDRGLSTNAHNVKIITVDGGVVLKGPVRSNDEKSKIEMMAANVVGKDRITSEIEANAK